MKSLVFILLLQCAIFLQAGIQNEQSSIESSKIVEKILINFLVEYIINDKTFISFVIRKRQETPFQRDLLDVIFNDLAFTATTYYFLNKLNDGTGHRKMTFNVILVESSETLE